VAQICEADPFCCGEEEGGYWDIVCVNRAITDCSKDCCGDGMCVGAGNTCSICPEDCGDCPCPHSVCEEGEALTAVACRGPECTERVCDQMPECCAGFFSWTTACMEAAIAECDGMGSCVDLVCARMPGCCSVGWSSQCVTEAQTVCNTDCDCNITLCAEGTFGMPPVADCDPCVTAVCDADPACCSGGWDPFCAIESSIICGLDC
jgi:hypothetical protein